jgi:hypothetical protein
LGVVARTTLLSLGLPVGMVDSLEVEAEGLQPVLLAIHQGAKVVVVTDR